MSALLRSSSPSDLHGWDDSILKIDEIILTHVRIPLIEPFRISSGCVSVKEGIVVALHSGGLVGYGESSPMGGSFYSADTPEKCWTELCARVAPAIVGCSCETLDEWNRTLDEVQGGNFTKTGVETALWDLFSKMQNKPLHRLLGGNRTTVESGLAVGLYDDIVDTLSAIERYLKSGYRRVKLKIEPGPRCRNSESGPAHVRRHSFVRGCQWRLHRCASECFSRVG